MIRKYAKKMGLSSIEVLIDDDLQDSLYFNVGGLPTVFPVGKSAFYLDPYPNVLKPTSEVKIELIDSTGAPVYVEYPRERDIDQYRSGYTLPNSTARLVSVNVYPETPSGFAWLYIVGEAEIVLNSNIGGETNLLNALDNPATLSNYSIVIPSDWRGIYNVRWAKRVFIDSSLRNPSPIIFYQEPSLSVSEIQKEYQMQYYQGDQVSLTGTSPSSSYYIKYYFNGYIADPTGLGLGIGLPRKELVGDNLESSPQGFTGTGEYTNTGENLGGETGQEPDTTPGPRGTPELISSPTKTPEPISGYSDPNSLPYATGHEVPTSILVADGFEFTSDMVGAVVTIPTPNVDPLALETMFGGEWNSEQYLRGEPIAGQWITNITRIINSNTAMVQDVYTASFSGDVYYPNSAQVRDDLGISSELIVDEFALSDFTMRWNAPVTYSRSEHFQSYAKVDVANLRTFSGEIDKLQLFFKSEGTIGDWKLISEHPINSINVLIEPTASENINNLGNFRNIYDASSPTGFVNNFDLYWLTSSFDLSSNVESATQPVITSAYNIDLIDGLMITTTTDLGSMLYQSIYLKRSTPFYSDDEITLSFNLIKRSGKGQLDVYMSGSAFNDRMTPVYNNNVAGVSSIFYDALYNQFSIRDPLYKHKFGKLIYSTTTNDTKRVDYGRVELRFKVDNDGIGYPLFAFRGGDWTISDVNIVYESEPGYHPDFYRLTAHIPVEQELDHVSFRLNYFSPDNVPSVLYSQLSLTNAFRGNSQYIYGTRNIVTGSLYLANSLHSGIELTSGVSSSGAYMRSIGYEGYASGSNQNRPGWMIYSGSVLPDSGDNYDGVGIELVASSSRGYRGMRFRTDLGRMEITGALFATEGHFNENFSVGTGSGQQRIEISASYNSGTFGDFAIIKSANWGQPNDSGWAILGDGRAYFGAAYISGTVSASVGNIGGFIVDSQSLYSENNSLYLYSGPTTSLQVYDDFGLLRWSVYETTTSFDPNTTVEFWAGNWYQSRSFYTATPGDFSSWTPTTNGGITASKETATEIRVYHESSTHGEVGYRLIVTGSPIQATQGSTVNLSVSYLHNDPYFTSPPFTEDEPPFGGGEERYPDVSASLRSGDEVTGLTHALSVTAITSPYDPQTKILNLSAYFTESVSDVWPEIIITFPTSAFDTGGEGEYTPTYQYISDISLTSTIARTSFSPEQQVMYLSPEKYLNMTRDSFVIKADDISTTTLYATDATFDTVYADILYASTSIGALEGAINRSQVHVDTTADEGYVPFFLPNGTVVRDTMSTSSIYYDLNNNRVGIGKTPDKGGLDISGNTYVTGNLEVSGLVKSAYITASDGYFDGDVTVTGILTAEEFHTEYVSSSIIYQSGSTKFGDTLDDTHQFTGSLLITGSTTFGYAGAPANSLDMANNTIVGVNNIVFADVGSNEGLDWDTNGGNWKIYESPNSLTNAAGNLQFVDSGVRAFTMQTDGIFSALNTTTTEINVSASTATSYGIFRIYNDIATTVGGKYMIGYGSSHATSANQLAIKNTDAPLITFYVSQSSGIATEVMRISGSNGYLGIGIPIPLERLHVSGNILIRHPENNGALILSPSNAGYGVDAEFVIQSAETTTGQSAPFHISRNAIFQTSDDTYQYIDNGGVAAQSMEWETDGDIQFKYAGAGTGAITWTNTVKIEGSTGRFGIGTTSPLVPLHISKNSSTALGPTTYENDDESTIQVYNSNTTANVFSGITFSGRSTGTAYAGIMGRYPSADNAELHFYTEASDVGTWAGSAIGTAWTFAGNVEIDGTLDLDGNVITSAGDLVIRPGGNDVHFWNAGFDAGLSLQHNQTSGNNSQRIYFKETEANDNYGFSLIFVGNSNPTFNGTQFTGSVGEANHFYLIHHENSKTGIPVLTIERTTGQVTGSSPWLIDNYLRVNGNITLNGSSYLIFTENTTTNKDFIGTNDASLGGSPGQFIFEHDTSLNNTSGSSTLNAGNIWLNGSSRMSYIEGDLGMGIPVPAAPIHIFNSDAELLLLERNGAGGSFMVFENGNDYQINLGLGSDNTFSIYHAASGDSGGTRVFNIQADTKIGLGISAPDTWMHHEFGDGVVFDDTDSTTWEGWKIENTSSVSDSAASLWFRVFNYDAIISAIYEGATNTGRLEIGLDTAAGGASTKLILDEYKIYPGVTSTNWFGSSSFGWRNMYIEHTSNLASGLVLQTSVTSVASPRLFFYNSVDWVGQGIVLVQKSANTLSFQYNATPQVSSGTEMLSVSPTELQYDGVLNIDGTTTSTFEGPINVTGDVIVGYGSSATILLDGTDGTLATNENGLFENVGNLQIQARGVIYLVADSDDTGAGSVVIKDGNSDTIATFDSVTNNTTFGGDILTTGPAAADIGTSTNYWSTVYTANVDSGAYLESKLKNECEDDALSKLPEGTVLIRHNGRLIPCYKSEDNKVIGVSMKDKDSPIVLGAELILIHGDIKEGDFIVTSDKHGHGERAKTTWFGLFKRNLTGRIIGQALESGHGDSHVIRAMIQRI